MGSYIIGSVPLLSIGISNSLNSINARTLMESAEILGATKLNGFLKIILPNIKDGLISTALFRFSSLFGEYVTVNLLLGGNFETIQIFLRSQINANGHYSSAIVVTYFAFVTGLTLLALVVLNQKGTQKA